MGFERVAATIMLLGFYLGIADGYLAIYKYPKTQPLQVLPYRTSLFPAEDQEALRQGIPFKTDRELNKLLEDFTS